MGNLRFRGLLLALGVTSAIWIGCGANGASSTEGDVEDASTHDGSSNQNPNEDQDGGIVFLDSGINGGDNTDEAGGGGGHPDTDGGMSGGGGTVLNCNDPNDEGGTEGTAKVLKATDDCDGDGASISGTIDGDLDTDMFMVQGNDTFGCEINPTATTPSTNVQFCMFIKCVNGGMSFGSCDGSVHATSDSGMDGCCLESPGTLDINYNCTGTTDDSVDAYMRIKGLKNVCLPYSATYHF